jgi:hypothetical protein
MVSIYQENREEESSVSIEAASQFLQAALTPKVWHMRERRLGDAKIKYTTRPGNIKFSIVKKSSRLKSDPTVLQGKRPAVAVFRSRSSPLWGSTDKWESF